ncbi:hypothetical protein Q9189_007175, partial [Teloschistes chrysophthalmus]
MKLNVSDEAVSTPPLRSPPSLRQVDGVEDRDNVDNEPSSGEGLVEEYQAAMPTQENLQQAGRIPKTFVEECRTTPLLTTDAGRSAQASPFKVTDPRYGLLAWKEEVLDSNINPVTAEDDYEK